MFTQSLVSHAYLSSPDCSSLALRSYCGPFMLLRSVSIEEVEVEVCPIRRPSSPLRLLIERRQVPRGECFPILKLRGFVQLAKSSACPAPPFTSRVSHIVASSCIVSVPVGHAATRPLRFVAISIALCDLFGARRQALS